MKNNHIILGKIYCIENLTNIYDELSSLDFDKTVSKEISRLDEDLLQLTFSDGVIIDIGWYPSFDEKGEFILQVIHDNDWEKPSLKISSGWNKNDLIEKLSMLLKQKNLVI